MYHFITKNRDNLALLNGAESKNGKKTHFLSFAQSCLDFFQTLMGGAPPLNPSEKKISDDLDHYFRSYGFPLFMKL